MILPRETPVACVDGKMLVASECMARNDAGEESQPVAAHSLLLDVQGIPGGLDSGKIDIEHGYPPIVHGGHAVQRSSAVLCLAIARCGWSGRWKIPDQGCETSTVPVAH